MANNDNSKETTFFRSRLHGLKVVVGPAKEGELDAESVSFVPYWERWDGDRVRVGYLKTDNPVAIEKLRADLNAEEIDETDFTAGTDESSKKPAVRASY